MLGEVRTRTARAVAVVEAAERRRERAGDTAGSSEDALRVPLARWMREMEALGVRVRGPWQVEFETEGGAFCWTWPESSLTRFRAREAADPTPIQ